MRNKVLFIIFTVLGIAAASVAAQVPQQPATYDIKSVSGGVLNGKAKTLVKPAYPAAARAVKAEGAVNVQVTIDEDGNVISAAAVSGHPLLRAAAVEAARASKFSPTTLSGQPVRVTGVVVYNFVSGDVPDGGVVRRAVTSNWFQVGQSLAALDGIRTLRFFQPSALNYMIPAEWSAEREQVQRLEELKKAELESTAPGDVPRDRLVESTSVSDSGKNPIRSETREILVAPDRKASSEVAAIGQSLTSSIQGRLASNELDLWYFNLGMQVNKAILNADSPDPEKRIDGVKPFREFIRNIPAGAPEGISADLEKIAAKAEKGIFSDQDKVEFTQLMMRLSPPPATLK